ncbi:hypothetical protein BV25DRAFT_1832830 [Artomyces pyxidatus]|uniref:Uncharacterized protein n=1 Tax=Artomyces pyxidatus TaxID=48021 RepID=A0ACB8SI00_9AGAM|nr:hypothetical protein BV25DRAFT_1832830 [Artomyces pyxidatus]
MLKLRLPAGASLRRGYATRLPEKPPMRHPDPLVNNPNAVVTPLPDELTFIHRPPPSAPTPLSYTTNPSSPLLRPAPQSTDGPLPPPLNTAKEQPPRLSDEKIADMQRLRAENPKYYSRSRLAKMFDCTPSFVSYMAPLPRPEKREVLAIRDEAHEEVRARWGEKKVIVREIRKKRKEFW